MEPQVQKQFITEDQIEWELFEKKKKNFTMVFSIILHHTNVSVSGCKPIHDWIFIGLDGSEDSIYIHDLQALQ